MSFIPFDRAPLLTKEDLQRRPAIDTGQLMRMLLIFMACVLALVAVARHGGDSGAIPEKITFQTLPS